MSRVHIPLGFSPQVWTDMNGQSLNPFWESSPDLDVSRATLVPEMVNPLLCQMNFISNSNMTIETASAVSFEGREKIIELEKQNKELRNLLKESCLLFPKALNL